MVDCKTTPKAEWYVLHGFMKNDKDVTGFLSMNGERTPGKTPYSIVHDISKALKFPSLNVYAIEGFGTPEQWKTFFEGEDELSSWKFCLQKIKSPMNEAVR